MNGSSKIIHRARWVIPIDKPSLEDGAVAVSAGRIVDVGRFADVKSACIGFSVKDYGDAVFLPGLVNAHTHLDNSAVAGATPRGSGDFVVWAEAFLSAKDSISVEKKREAINAACTNLVDYGTIAVGDICPTLLSPPYLVELPVWGSIFIEMTGVGRERGKTALAESKEKLSFALVNFINKRLSFSLAPHAPYSTDPSLIERIITENSSAGRLTSFHLAESPQEEAILMGEHDGFGGAMRKWDFMEEGFQPPRMRPVAYLESLGGLAIGRKMIAVHCVQLNDSEIERLARSGCSICLCPRSNDYIGFGQPRIADMLAAGIEPCLGTDGLGSVDTLSVFDEMAFIRQRHPAIQPETLLRMAMINGARALRLDAELGSLSPGKIARFLVYREELGGEPHEALTSGIDGAGLEWIDGD